MKDLVVVAFLSALLLPSIASSSSSLKTFNESCDGDCDERKGLSCSSSSKVCACMNPNATLYDKARQLCVTKAGHPCRRLSGAAAPFCVPNALCSSPGAPCACLPNFFQTRNGTCFPAAKYGEACSGKKPCDKSAGIECSPSASAPKGFSCQCKYPQDAFYSKETSQCVSFVGGNCSFALPCVPHASCSLDIFEVRKGETPQGKTYTYNATVGRKCACVEGFKGTQDRACLPTFLSPCLSESPQCNLEEGLKCVNKEACLCGSPLGEEHSSKHGRCLALVGSSCSSSSSKCVENASCSRETEECECEAGFSGTPGRKCLKDFGEKCGTPGDCNVFRSLHCDGGTCGCVDGSLEWSGRRRRCVGRRGAVCGPLQLDMKTGSVTAMTSKGEVSSDVTQMSVECGDGLSCLPSEFPSLSRCLQE